MIKNIVFSSLFLCLCIASALYIAGYQKVELGVPFLSFLNRCNDELNSFTIAIPNIPMIPTADEFFDMESTDNIVSILFGIYDLFFGFVNFISNILNITINTINVFIATLQFTIIVIKNLITLKDNIVDYNSSSVLLMLI